MKENNLYDDIDIEEQELAVEDEFQMDQDKVFQTASFADLEGKERAERAKICFNGMKTVADKVYFLAAYGAYVEAARMSGVKDIQHDTDMYLELQDVLADTYIINGTAQDCKAVFQALAIADFDNNIDMYEAQTAFQQSLKQDEPYRDKKAFYLSKFATAGGIKNLPITTMTALFSNQFMNAPGMMEKVFKDLKVTEETTMEELAKMVGYKKEESIKNFATSRGVDLKDNALQYYSKDLHDPKLAKEAMKMDLLEAIIGSWKKSTTNSYVKKLKTKAKNNPDALINDPDLMNGIEKISANNKEELSTSKFKDWETSVGQPTIKQHEPEFLKETQDYFINTFITPFEKDLRKVVDEAEVENLNIEPVNDIIEKKAQKPARKKKVTIDKDLREYLYSLKIRAGQARGASDSPQYTQFYSCINDTLDLVDVILEKRKKGVPFNEEKAYKKYVAAVNDMKTASEIYEAYKLHFRTENPEGEKGKKKVNSKDKEKLSIVRSVRRKNHKYFNVEKPEAKKSDPNAEFLKKADKALARLAKGKYSSKKAYLEDAAYGVIGYMARSSGGTFLQNPKTGEFMALEDFKDKLLKSKQLDQMLKSTSNPGQYTTPDAVLKALNNKKYHDKLLKSYRKISGVDAAKLSLDIDENDINILKLGSNKDELNISNQIFEDDQIENKKLINVNSEDYNDMLKFFAKDIEKFRLDIYSTYGKGKSDSSPSSLMEDVIKAMTNFSAKGKKKGAETPEGRARDMMKLSPDEFDTKVNALIKSIDKYLNKRQNPTKGDRVDRNEHMMSLKRKLLDYKNENRDIFAGKSGKIHEFKLGDKNEGNVITNTEIKKNLIKFVYDMQISAMDGEVFLLGCIPEENERHQHKYNEMPYPRPTGDLKKVTDAWVDWRNLFRLDENGNPKKMSFDIIKEKVTKLNRELGVYVSKHPNESNNTLEVLMTTTHGIMENMELLQPYMDVKTIEGRIGGQNLYETVKNMEAPYKDLKNILLRDEYVLDMELSHFKSDEERKQSVNAIQKIFAKLDKDKNLVQNTFYDIQGIRAVYNPLLDQKGNNNATRPAGADLKPHDYEARKQALANHVIRELFYDNVEKENKWLELAKLHNKGTLQVAVEDIMGKAVTESEAFNNVQEGATYDNITAKFVKEAKRLGTYEEIKEKLRPVNMKEKLEQAAQLREERAKQVAEQNKKLNIQI